MKKALLTLLVLLIAVACVATPKWYKTARNNNNDNDLLIGLGSANSREQALDNARIDLLQQISVKVQSITELQQESIESEGKEYYAESINKATKLTVDQTVMGLKVEKEVVEKKTWYVQVSLSKSAMISSLREELKQINSSVSTLIEDADKLSKRGDIFLAIKNYTDAQEIIPELISKKSLYDSFSSMPFFVSENKTVNSVNSKIRRLLTEIRFEIISGNNQTAKKGSQLAEAIVFRAVVRDAQSGETVGINGMPVKVLYSDGLLIERGLTNEDGLFSVNAMASPSQGDKGKIIIQMDSYRLPAFFNATLNSIVGNAFFTTIETSPLTVQVVVKNNKGKRLDKAERSLVKNLNNNNVQVDQSSPLLMSGIVNIKESKVVEGVGTKQYLVVVEMDVQLSVIATKEILGSISAIGRGMSAKNEDEALQKAYDSIAINSRELKQMIANVEDKTQGIQQNK
ncbi:MAG TPA: LPP20 family lipoprotein [Candidatus Cloacimonadota bacterium]|nr:LPP20 family lipoprotein [Candidatus Cloacimonadota bacterium]HOQ80271.1 LPP20 family lipoprotein [Candidatus Cloacimonadota bacterium]HPK40282.1 LPP20 family lipoprotein [Candidatus Cloacimonadota bacterium]